MHKDQYPKFCSKGRAAYNKKADCVGGGVMIICASISGTSTMITLGVTNHRKRVTVKLHFVVQHTDDIRKW